MFSQHLNAIVRTFDARRVPVPRIPAALKAAFAHEARRALSHTPVCQKRAASRSRQNQ